MKKFECRHEPCGCDPARCRNLSCKFGYCANSVEPHVENRKKELARQVAAGTIFRRDSWTKKELFGGGRLQPLAIAMRDALCAPTGEEIKKIISDAGISQAAAAELVGVKVRELQRWVADEVPISQAAWELLKIKVKKIAFCSACLKAADECFACENYAYYSCKRRKLYPAEKTARSKKND